ncbi:hypothetical protein N7448_002908 [Penicillium atrosanguineum]|nr:hypothetical protein N7448_002908 [Penicillium atrosanguineum]
MKDSLYDRLWRRECGELSSTAGLRGIYGSKEWINDLDIVNELGGHTGCVNALSWSRSGRLLASGSDDQHLNIYSYQPESSNAPFSLNATVATGHKANIFSVKFMPHSNDRTLITCAGDSQVRVFDIELSSGNSNNNVNANATSAFAASARSRRFNNFFEGTRYLSEGNTNARVYRSHADRVKRIVTESSPYLFLTCSEDGEVRQWDLRQPSSAYPSPRGGQGFMAYRPGLEHDDSNVPPPLISYKKFRLDLNTISCSPTQPHYIALGGAHMHCFLHDRRMLGRDTSSEQGTPDVATPSVGSVDDELMGKATRCVRRFAPRGKRRVRRLDDGHITACKISDANPDEMVVSWSGDHIYSFDLIRSPDARDSSSEGSSKSKTTGTGRKNGSRSGKRKRPKPSSMSSQESATRHHSRRRSADPDTLRVQYENGESSDIPFPEISEGAETSEGILERARYSVLNDAQRLSMEIAKGLVKLRQALFSLKVTAREAAESEQSDLTPYSESFESALDLATTYLPQMERVMREWAYPMNPSQGTVGLERSLREHRQASWRFVQAAGTLARVLLHTTGDSETPVDFSQISPAPNEDGTIDREAQFGYDFLKAIFLWLQGGRQELLRGFKRGVYSPRVNGRFPLDADADEDAIDSTLLPYLQDLAGESPVVNVDASRFEYDSARIVFQTQKAAVVAFGNAVKLPLENLGTTAARIDRRRVSNPSSQVRSLDRASATRFWILRVSRGILLQAGNGVNYSFVNRAFGGLHTSAVEDSSDIEVERSQDDAEANEEEQAIRTINLVRSGGSARAAANETATSSDDNNGESSDDEDLERLPVTHESDSDDEDEDEGSDSDGESDVQEEDGWHMDLVGSDEEESESDEPLYLRGASRKSRRGHVELDTPCSAHTRVYRGHCNIKTVKDVNFFGLNDEYVVSGSDSGHVFIWNRETAELLNILEGDSEVVNVVQGHPYEPTLAVSGIDNTIKVFSPDRHAQEQARRGRNILDPDSPVNVLGTTAHNLGGLQSRKRLSDSYRIMGQNDVDRRGGMSEAYITRSMLARLAATLRGRQGGAGGAGGLGAVPGEGASVVLDDNCVVCALRTYL